MNDFQNKSSHFLILVQTYILADSTESTRSSQSTSSRAMVLMDEAIKSASKIPENYQPFEAASLWISYKMEGLKKYKEPWMS